MPTTIQVSKENRRMLEKLKKEMGLETYDQVIGKLVRKKSGMPESFFGACRRSKPFKREPEIEHKL